MNEKDWRAAAFFDVMYLVTLYCDILALEGKG